MNLSNFNMTSLTIKLNKLREDFSEAFKIDFDTKSRRKHYVDAKKSFVWYCSNIKGYPISKVSECINLTHDVGIFHRDSFIHYVNKDVSNKLYKATGFNYYDTSREDGILESIRPIISKLPKGREKDFKKFVELKIKSYISLYKDNNNENKTKIYYVADSVSDYINQQ